MIAVIFSRGCRLGSFSGYPCATMSPGQRKVCGVAELLGGVTKVEGWDWNSYEGRHCGNLFREEG